LKPAFRWQGIRFAKAAKVQFYFAHVACFYEPQKYANKIIVVLFELNILLLIMPTGVLAKAT